MFPGPYVRPPYNMDTCQITESKFLNLSNELLMEQLKVVHKGRLGFELWLQMSLLLKHYISVAIVYIHSRKRNRDHPPTVVMFNFKKSSCLK